MTIIESPTLIPATLFGISKIDGLTREKIIQHYPHRTDGAYYLNKFVKYLQKKYSLSLRDYCVQYLKIKWPQCPISHQDVGYKISGKGIELSKFRRGCLSRQLSPAFDAACNRFSLERKGNQNPMFGREAWNKGKDKRNPIIKAIGAARIGMIFSDTTKKKQSDSAKKRIIHGHSGCKHTKSTIRKLKAHTAALWASGRFARVSSIHIKMREFLNTLSLVESYKEEHQVSYFSMDFAFPLHKIAIECQGTFFHVDPRIYPNGPINAIQRRNFGRDKVKRLLTKRQGWTIIEVWETEINDGSFKKDLQNQLKKQHVIL